MSEARLIFSSTDATQRAMLEAEGYAPLELTFARPVQVPVWHLYVGQYFLYPSPWVLGPKRFLGRAACHHAARLESRLRGGGVGYCAQNLVGVARVV